MKHFNMKIHETELTHRQYNIELPILSHALENVWLVYFCRNVLNCLMIGSLWCKVSSKICVIILYVITFFGSLISAAKTLVHNLFIEHVQHIPFIILCIKWNQTCCPRYLSEGCNEHAITGRETIIMKSWKCNQHEDY